MNKDSGRPLISVVIPVYFNELNLTPLKERLLEALGRGGFDFEIIFVDDGSRDSSFSILKCFTAEDSRIKIIKLSRNFGSFVACLAGLSNVSGDCAVVISADLQDPPELIPDMVSQWIEGHKVVLAVREDREDPLVVRVMSALYYKLMRRFALKDMPPGGFDFFLIDREVIKVIVKIKEKNTSLPGLVLWLGFPKKLLYYTRKERELGNSMWTFSKKIKHFIDSFTAFSYFPLRLASVAGMITAILGFFYGFLIVVLQLIFQKAPEGWSALMVVVLILGGIQLLTLGVIGEYLWRNFDETRSRPTYIIEEAVGISGPQ
tara:strand:+ start:1739 stop:2692 length:954 start_codon:yes stop_codon:yes gene_type:complete